jgi:two-component system chemotaxis family response regulator WspR
VLPNTSPGGARLVAEKLRQTVAALKSRTSPRAEGASLTISIGLATMTARHRLPEADRRRTGVVSAKNNGRNQVGIE